MRNFQIRKLCTILRDYLYFYKDIFFFFTLDVGIFFCFLFFGLHTKLDIIKFLSKFDNRYLDSLVRLGKQVLIVGHNN